MIEGLVALAGVAIVAGSFLAIGPLVLRLIGVLVARRDAKPIPARWMGVIERNVPAVLRLTATERIHLLHSVRELIATRHWEGCGGLALTLEMQLTVAAQACLLSLGLPGEPYPELRQILLYPRSFLPKRVCDPRQWLPTSAPEQPRPELGESWGNGIIVLAWDSALAGSQDPGDGTNLVFHEFAHELAFEHRLAPAGISFIDLLSGPRASGRPDVPDPEAWRRVLEGAFERLCAKVETRTPTVLDPYAATNLAEFFAVATEVVFERPHDLRHEYSPLYDQFRTS